MFKYYLLVVLLINIMFAYRGIYNQKIEYLITPVKNDIYYKCNNQKINLDGDSKFKCNSFPVTFNEIGTASNKDIKRVIVASLKN